MNEKATKIAGMGVGGDRITDEEVISAYQRIVNPDAAKQFDKTNGWFERYNGKLADPEQGRRYLRAIRNTVLIPDRELQGKKVLDIGCGFGITCSTLALLGADEVHGVDMFEEMVDTVKAYLPTLPRHERVHPRVGRADALPYEDNQFDVALTVEALSHFLNPSGCLAEAYRVLKPGGVYIIADDNNGANPSVLRENQEVWDQFENGPPTKDIHGHRVLEPYIDKRKRIVSEAFPELKEEDAGELARRTAFMTKPDILAAAETFIKKGELPDSIYGPGKCPIEPEQGQYIENLLNPLVLKDELERSGFRVKLEAYFGGASRGGLLLMANRLLNLLFPARLLLRVSSGFRIRAYK
jgi:ubiquinone/menaquinone biosynthesis C-methylase UbiE